MLLAEADVFVVYWARVEVLLWNELMEDGLRSGGRRGCGTGTASMDDELVLSFFTSGGGSSLGGVDFRDDLRDVLDGGRRVSMKGKRSFIRLEGLSINRGRSSRGRLEGRLGG